VLRRSSENISANISEKRPGMNDFDGMVAVVTGGASGIGAATAALLLSRGARVAVLDRSFAEIGGPSADGQLLTVPCDVSGTASADAAIDIEASTFGGIDVLINNAGIGAIGDIAANDDDEWMRVLSVNVAGIARVTRPAATTPVRPA